MNLNSLKKMQLPTGYNPEPKASTGQGLSVSDERVEKVFNAIVEIGTKTVQKEISAMLHMSMFSTNLAIRRLIEAGKLIESHERIGRANIRYVEVRQVC